MYSIKINTLPNHPPTFFTKTLLFLYADIKLLYCINVIMDNNVTIFSVFSGVIIEKRKKCFRQAVRQRRFFALGNVDLEPGYYRAGG
jgi:hypothetical protein